MTDDGMALIKLIEKGTDSVLSAKCRPLRLIERWNWRSRRGPGRRRVPAALIAGHTPTAIASGPGRHGSAASTLRSRSYAWALTCPRSSSSGARRRLPADLRAARQPARGRGGHHGRRDGMTPQGPAPRLSGNYRTCTGRGIRDQWLAVATHRKGRRTRHGIDAGALRREDRHDG